MKVQIIQIVQHKILVIISYQFLLLWYPSRSQTYFLWQYSSMPINQFIQWSFDRSMTSHPIRPKSFTEYRMPLPQVFFDLFLDNLNENLIRCLTLSIGLSIVRRWINQLETCTSSKVFKLLGCKRLSLISCNGLRDSKSINNMLSNELNHISWWCYH